RSTPAADLAPQVPEAVKADRLARLQALLASQQLAFNQRFVGAEVDVLLERPGRQAGQWIGRSPHMQSVVVEDRACAAGQMVRVAIVAAGPNSLAGRCVGLLP
ncbi:MAG: TRAM domain-containing protein, partial [Sphingomonadaceae bacterium]